MKTKTNTWVAELLDGWLAEVTDSEILDQFAAQIEQRRLTLQASTEDLALHRLMRTYRDIKVGTVMYTRMSLAKAGPLPGRNRQGPPRDPWKYHRVKLWKWMPRKKIMWVEVDWETHTKKWGRYFVLLTTKQLETYQPSRTEPDVRQRAEEREHG